MIYYKIKNIVTQDFNETVRVGNSGPGTMLVINRPARKKKKQTGGGGRCMLAGFGSFIIKTRKAKTGRPKQS